MKATKSVSVEEIEKSLSYYKDKWSEEKYKKTIEYMAKLKADPTIPRMFRVTYQNQYVGLVKGTYISGLKEAIDMLKSLKDFNMKIIVDTDIVLDDSLAWNYTHM